MYVGCVLESAIVEVNNGTEVGISLLFIDGIPDGDIRMLVGSTVGSPVGSSVSEDAWVGTLDDASRGADEPENTTGLGNSVYSKDGRICGCSVEDGDTSVPTLDGSSVGTSVSLIDGKNDTNFTSIDGL